jgi:autotransporter-associated beta strand protein
VLFDDSAASFNVAIQPASVAPASVTFTNDLNAYVLSGGAINGAATLSKSGGALLAITNDNSYTGGTTIAFGSAIQLGDGTNATGSLGSGPVTNDGSLFIEFGASNGTLANAIGGGGNLVKNGTGTLVVSGANTYGGGTTISAGTLELAGSGTLGSGGVVNNAAIVTTGDTTLSNDISGTGSFTQAGGGVVTLTGNNTYAGATTINAGATLQIGNGGGSGTPGAGAIANAGTLVIDRGDNLTVPEINGAGTLSKRGAGALTLSGANTAGSLSIGSNNAGGSVVVPAGASLAVGDAGTGSLTIGTSGTPTGGTGILDVSAASSFSANVATITIGATGNNAVTSDGQLHLPGTSSLTAATSFIVGDSLGARNGDNGVPTSVITTGGAGTTTVRTPIFTLGGSKATVTFTLGAGNTLDVAGVAAGERTAMSVGNMFIGGGGGNYGSTVDLSAGIFNASLSSLMVGNQSTDLSSSNLNASLTIGAGATNHLDVSGPGSVVVVGRQTTGSATGIATGTLTIGNLDATSAITSIDNGTGILVGSAVTAGNAVGTVNLNGGMLTITTTGAAIAGGLGTSTVNFNGMNLIAGASSGGWIQGLTNANVQAGGVIVDTNAYDVAASQVFAHDAALGATPDGGLAKSGAGTLALGGANTYTGPTTASGGKLVLGKSLTTSSSVSALNDATIELANDGSHNQFIKTDTITIDPGATIDIKDNKLLTNTPIGSFSGGAYTGVQGEVARAYNFGAWDLPGLKTSEELAGPNAGPLSGTTTIGVATGEQILFLGPTDTGVFAGQTITGATTIAMYTYAGDMNFDGLVDAADYGVIDNWVQFPGTDGYANGDLNYDGVIDAADYGIIDNTIQLQGAPFPGWDSAGSAAAGLGGVAAVPEPGAAMLASVAVANLLRRRRRAR